MVEVSVHPFIPRLVEWCELTMLDEWANAVFTGDSAQFLVVISLVAGQHFDELCIAFHHPWRDLRGIPNLQLGRHTRENGQGTVIEDITFEEIREYDAYVF